MKSDVLIIGGGPAGLKAGKTIASNDLNVIIVDKEFENKSAQLVYKSGLKDLDLKIDNSYLLNELRKVSLVSPNENKVNISNENINSNEVGYIIDSKNFNKYLLNDAKSVGCEIKENTTAIALEKINNGYKITCKNNEKEYDVETKILIVADGFPSHVSRALGFKSQEKFAKIYQCELDEIDMDLIEFHFGSISPNGYIWIYPKKDSKLELGISIEESNLKISPKQYLLNFINSYFNLELEDIDCISGKIPINSLVDKFYGDNILICGDAAGQTNPFIGGGLISSMKGAKYAGEVATEAIKNNDCSKEFLRKYRSLVLNDFGFNFDKLAKIRDYAFSLSDDEIDKIAISFEGVSFDDLNVVDILKRLIKISPSAIFKLGKLL
ncbi:MAG: NAD(P)/FAD-dependent oxidoreductase [Methanobacteriaceae archaeon]|jgi:digeranylgeranylglycerophospholipid reductase|nr:NAD(P)/FAD-dependent oxidoreductase [Methanobacteriaceae archaeon]